MILLVLAYNEVRIRIVLSVSIVVVNYDAFGKWVAQRLNDNENVFPDIASPVFVRMSVSKDERVLLLVITSAAFPLRISIALSAMAENELPVFTTYVAP